VPELPEVEITRRGIAPHLIGQAISGVVIRHPRLRWPISPELVQVLPGQRVVAVHRRAKYLLLEFASGHLILHLGMSGSLRILPAETPPGAHDHFDVLFDKQALRLRDPRRFGAVLWHARQDAPHPLLSHLGVEPLSQELSGAWLHDRLRKRKQAIKLALMDASLVVGVGNIYANESLFRAGIRPRLAAYRVSRLRCDRLVEALRATLNDALAAGGSSLRDFVHSDGSAGYFQQSYAVYGRDGAVCRVCGAPIRRIVQGQRATFYCPNCQR
jgi:formamidopyrimidine-DNA glycosylase